MNYIINDGELYHYGVKGMKWGHRKSVKFAAKAKNARAAAKEFDATGRAKANQLLAKGKIKKAAKVEAKFRSKGDAERAKATRYDEKSARKQRESDFQGKQAEVGKSRSKGAKLATNLLNGFYANRTYNSVIAAGKTKTMARAATFATGVLGGPLGHIVVSHVMTKHAGDKK
jgi:hypothetical protein